MQVSASKINTEPVAVHESESARASLNQQEIVNSKHICGKRKRTKNGKNLGCFKKKWLDFKITSNISNFFMLHLLRRLKKILNRVTTSLRILRFPFV